MIVGPSPDMAELVREHGIGLVTEGADAVSLRAVLEELDAERVDAFKRAADAAAHELSAEVQITAWDEAVSALAARG